MFNQIILLHYTSIVNFFACSLAHSLAQYFLSTSFIVNYGCAASAIGDCDVTIFEDRERVDACVSERGSVDKQQNSCAQFHPKLIAPTVVKIEYNIENMRWWNIRERFLRFHFENGLNSNYAHWFIMWTILTGWINDLSCLDCTWAAIKVVAHAKAWNAGHGRTLAACCMELACWLRKTTA